jgi:chemotaxis protein MotB
MAAGGGGAWKVAYADFVTAMMAFFMVMWLTSQKPEVKEAVSEYFKNPSGRRIAGTPNSSIMPSKNESTGGRRSRARGTESDPRETKMLDEGKNTNVGTMILFEANTAQLTEESMDKLKALLPELKGKPHRIDVRGHAVSDGQANQSFSLDAYQISYQRALVTMGFLVEAGVEPNRIRLSAAGASEPRYEAANSDPVNNARVEVYLLDETYEPLTKGKEKLTSSSKADPHGKSKDVH